MIEALKPTGEVIAEGLCVERETFGDTRDKVPAISVMQDYEGNTNPRYAYDFFNFKLEENKYHLIAMCEIELAWLKCERRSYTDSYEERGKLRPEINMYIDNLRKINNRKSEKLHCVWKGKEYYLNRGVYLDIPEFIKMFLKYWKL